MSKYQRTKGHNFERKVVNDLKNISYKAKRILEYQVENANGIDVDTEEGFVFQCKKGKNISVKDAYKEIKEGKKIGVVVASWDRDLTLACLDWNDFLTILEWLKDKGVK